MIFGMRRSVFFGLLLLTLLVGGTLGVLIVSAMRSRAQVDALTTADLEAQTELNQIQRTEQPSSTPSMQPTDDLTPTSSPTSSRTVPPPTKTFVVSQTLSPTVDLGTTPTITLTPDINICAEMDVDFIKATSTVALFRLRNGNKASTTITHIVLGWPDENDAVFNAILDGSVFWAGVEMNSPTDMTTWRGELADRSVRGVHALEFFFGTPAAQRGYHLEISFENGCTISTTN
jgi:hypothetical protein